MNIPETPLSASRIKTAESCSWLYWCKYKLNSPDKSNDVLSESKEYIEGFRKIYLTILV